MPHDNPDLLQFLITDRNVESMETEDNLDNAEVIGALEGGSECSDFVSKLPNNIGDLLEDLPLKSGSVDSDMSSLGGTVQTDEVSKRKLNQCGGFHNHSVYSCDPVLQLELDGVLSILDKWDKLENPDCEC